MRLLVGGLLFGGAILFFLASYMTTEYEGLASLGSTKATVFLWSAAAFLLIAVIGALELVFRITRAIVDWANS